jgi:hypothetical protein
MERRDLSGAVGALLPGLLQKGVQLLEWPGALDCSDILEGDGALDLLASEDGLVVPANEDADVAGTV